MLRREAAHGQWATVCCKERAASGKWQVAWPVRWAYCVKNKINCVRTYNPAMNQNHTSWLYIDIRLAKIPANECQSQALSLSLFLYLSVSLSLV